MDSVGGLVITMPGPVKNAFKNPFQFGDSKSNSFKFPQDSETESRLSSMFKKPEVQVGLAAASQNANRPFGFGSIG